MLTRRENELLCRVEGEAPMGQMIRRFWIPACLSEEIPEPDCKPRRLRILGEDLVAFRDTSGRIGVLAEHCPHRGSSLRFGRNEHNGLRCLYHGWKMDVEGNVLETPCEPPESTLRRKVKQTAYPTRENGDLVWVYMGPREKEPPFPRFMWTTVPPANRCVVKFVQPCNWVQALEGLVDSAHAGILHFGYLLEDAATKSIGTRDISPRLEAEDTPYGFRYAAIRRVPRDPTKKNVRVTQFIMPFHSLFGGRGAGSLVPIDDTHTIYFRATYDKKGPIDAEGFRQERRAIVGLDLDEEYRPFSNLENDFHQDREAMRRGRSFSGIAGVSHEDMAQQDSEGPLYDRTTEHLGVSDIAVIRLRKRLLGALRDFLRGEEPLGARAPVAFERLGGDEKTIPSDDPWQEVGAYETRDPAAEAAGR